MGVGFLVRKGKSNGKKYLYKSGDQYSALTGGWTSSGQSVTSGFTRQEAAFNTDHILLQTTTGDKMSPAVVVNSIDLSKYTKIYFKINCLVQPQNFGVGIFSSHADTDWPDSALVQYNSSNRLPTGERTISLDISAINSGYPGANAWTTSVTPGYGQIKILEVWLEG